jgi:hypothetical protein
MAGEPGLRLSGPKAMSALSGITDESGWAPGGVRDDITRAQIGAAENEAVVVRTPVAFGEHNESAATMRKRKAEQTLAR